MLRKEHIGARRCRSSRSSRGVLTFKLWLFYYLKAMRHTVTWIGRTLLRMELNGKLNKVRVGECLLIRDARITGAWLIARWLDWRDWLVPCIISPTKARSSPSHLAFDSSLLFLFSFLFCLTSSSLSKNMHLLPRETASPPLPPRSTLQADWPPLRTNSLSPPWAPLLNVALPEALFLTVLRPLLSSPLSCKNSFEMDVILLQSSWIWARKC